MEKAYNRRYWKNSPSRTTPIDAESLDYFEAGLDVLDNRMLSVDNNLNNLTNDWHSLFEYSDNRFDKNNVYSGYAYYLNGKIMESDAYYYTDYIDLLGVECISVSRLFHIAFYDEFKAFVGGTAIASNALAVSGQCVKENITLNSSDYSAVIKIPKSSRFMIVSLRTTYIDVFHFNFGNVLSDYDSFGKIIKPAYMPYRKNPKEIFGRLQNESETLKVVFAGDSQTAGSGGTGFSPNGTLIVNDKYRNEAGYCWANLLKEYLEKTYNCTCYNNGIAGISSGYVATYIKNIIPSDTDICVLMIGTNNRQSENYVNMLRGNLATILDYCDVNKIDLILMIPLMLSSESENSSEYYCHMDKIAQIEQGFCVEHGLEPIDFYRFTQDYCDIKNVTMDDILPDKIHPGDSFYTAMYKHIARETGLHLPVDGAFW